MELTQKETDFLKDLKGEEKLCVEKYTKHARNALDPQLKELFTTIANVEQQHFNTVLEIENGNIPDFKKGSAQSINKQFTSKYSMGDTKDKQADSYLCNDLLAQEKHVASVYDTAIFEFSEDSIRNILSDIQKEEQEHGKAIYDYMSTNYMYS